MATADTIAVKCPGCQAGFDVPTSLAGKTIRCTSCKTQLPVPAGRARGAAAALPTAKTAPARPSNGPPGKSAAELLPRGGKPNRPRDDDDEDDDDEDDRPARRSSKKKKAASGGSAMPLILGVVGVLVLAGGGIGAYFLFKKDPPATASNSSSSSTTPPAGGTKGGPPPGMTMPGGGNPQGGTPAAPPEGWEIVRGDGFTVHMPGGADKNQAVSIPTPKGVISMQMTGRETPKKDGGFMVLTLALPTEVQARDPRDILNSGLDGAEKGAGAEFNPFAGPTSKLKILSRRDTTVDGHPAVDLDIAPEKAGGFAIGKAVVANGRFIFAFTGHDTDLGFKTQSEQFLATLKITAPGEQVAANTPAGPEAGPPGRGGLPRRGADGGPVAGGTTPMPGNGPPPGMTFPMPGGTTPMPGPGGPPPGMTFPMPGPGGPPPGMTFPMPGPGGPPPGMTFPMPGPGGPPPGMNIPGAPPPPAGTFPMVGMPPGALNPGGGTPGFGGPSGGTGYVTPALATQIDPFFAIAFDADKSEVFTVSLQPVSATKATYKLNRYTYPAFVPKGYWKIPSLGVRAALDPAGGKLYLATALFSKSVYDQKGDRIAGTGEVAVYDLAGVRDGRVKEQAELKPAATIAAGGTVRGLDVSADGKLLTVLTSRTTSKGGKASLRQYDTADRKLVKEKELPNAAWDMARSGDKLLVLEDPRASSGQSLMVCDAATLEAQPLALPPGTTDVAFGPDGKMVAASGASGGKSGDLTVVERGAPQKKVLATAVRKNQNGYARFTPDGKKLLVASHGLEQQNFGPGLDVYDVTDPADPNTYKRAATVRSAGLQYVGGYFHLSPDGERVVIQLTGAVLETAKLTEHVGGAEPPGLNGPGGPGEPGGIGPGAGPMGPVGPGRGGPGFGMPPGAAPPPVLGGPNAPMPVQPGPPGAAPPPTLPVPGAPGTVPMPGAPGTVPMPGVPGEGGAAPPAVGAPGRGRPAPGAPAGPGDGPRPGLPPPP